MATLQQSASRVPVTREQCINEAGMVLAYALQGLATAPAPMESEVAA